MELPASLHTVRILIAVARNQANAQAAMPMASATRLILNAARIVGYDGASQNDPLIVKAAQKLAKGA
jgi:hypothetical protein